MRPLPLRAHTAAPYTSHQFMDTITSKHVGFPESELTILFGFFRTPMPSPCSSSLSSSSNSAAATASSTTATGRGRRARRRLGSGRASDSGTGAYGADWTVAVACLWLLARPKGPVLSAIRGVFEVFARAAADRVCHRQRLGQERRQKEREMKLEAERERWKRRRWREAEGLPATAPGVCGTLEMVIDENRVAGLDPTRGLRGGQEGVSRCLSMIKRRAHQLSTE